MRQIKLRLLLNFISKLSLFTILPFTTLYYSTNFGLQIAGILLIISTIFQVIGTIYGGFFSSKYNRISVVKIGEVLKLIFFILLFFFGNSIVFTIVIILVNIIQGVLNPSNDSILLDLTKEDNATKIASFNYWLNNIAILLGTIIGGSLYHTNIRVLKLGLVISSVIICILLQWSKEVSKRNNSLNIIQSYGQAVRNKKYFAYLIGIILIYAVELQRNNYILTVLPQKSIFLNYAFSNTTLLSFLTTINTIIVITLLPITIKMYNGDKLKKYLNIGVVTFSLGYAVLSYSDNVLVLVIASIFIASGEILFTPASQNLFLNSIGSEDKGRYVALNNVSVQIAQMISGFYLVIAVYLPEIVNSLLILVMGIIGLIMMSKSNERSRYEKNNFLRLVIILFFFLMDIPIW